MVTPEARRQSVRHLVRRDLASVRRACRIVGLSRSVAQYRRRRRQDEALRNRLVELARKCPRYGYLTLHGLLRAEGLVVNRKRTWCLYREAGLQVRRRRRKKLARPRMASSQARRWTSGREATGVTLHFIQPGKPVQNACVESFNGRFRDACLNQHWFADLREARRLIADWHHHYSHVRPHSSLCYVAPATFLEKVA